MGEVVNIIIGLMIMSSVVIGVMAFSADLFTNYGIISEDLSYLNKTSEINEQMEEVKDSIEASKTGNVLIDVPFMFVAGAMSALKLLFNLPDIIVSFIADVSSILTLPAWVGALFSALIVVIIIFVVLKAILKWDI